MLRIFELKEVKSDLVQIKFMTSPQSQNDEHKLADRSKTQNPSCHKQPRSNFFTTRHNFLIKLHLL